MFSGHRECHDWAVLFGESWKINEFSTLRSWRPLSIPVLIPLVDYMNAMSTFSRIASPLLFCSFIFFFLFQLLLLCQFLDHGDSLTISSFLTSFIGAVIDTHSWGVIELAEVFLGSLYVHSVVNCICASPVRFYCQVGSCFSDEMMNVNVINICRPHSSYLRSWMHDRVTHGKADRVWEQETHYFSTMVSFIAKCLLWYEDCSTRSGRICTVIVITDAFFYVKDQVNLFQLI